MNILQKHFQLQTVQQELTLVNVPVLVERSRDAQSGGTEPRTASGSYPA